MRIAINLGIYSKILQIFFAFQITVNVLDVNDNKPVFQPAKSSGSVSIREDSGLGTTVATVQATDKDAGQNGSVSYGISAGNDQGNTKD